MYNAQGFDPRSSYNLIEDRFECQVCGSGLEYRGGIFEAPDDPASYDDPRLECPDCGHALSTLYPSIVLQRTSRSAPNYVHARWAVVRLMQAIEIRDEAYAYFEEQIAQDAGEWIPDFDEQEWVPSFEGEAPLLAPETVRGLKATALMILIVLTVTLLPVIVP